MPGSFRCLLLTLTAVLLTSCGDSGSPPAPAGNAGATPAFAVLSKSGIAMVALPGGEFAMGSNAGNPDESPPHRVRLSPFLMDRLEVTHEMFAKVQLPDPSRWQDNPRGPVERVRWLDAKRYCNERSLLEGLKPCYNEKSADWVCDYTADGYRLPTEAEWEYACRAGTEGAFDFDPPARLRQFAWFAENADQRTHAGGGKKSNPWGIDDLYGNVSEWCEDVYSPTYYKESPTVDPTGPANPGRDVRRVMRGGNWKSAGDACRVTYRQGQRTGDTDACFYTDYCGFRCVRRASAPDLATLARPKP